LGTGSSRCSRITGDIMAIVINGSGTVSGLTAQASDVELTDSTKIMLGTGDDLQIYHNGSESIIADSGTGNLKIYGDNLELQSSSTGEAYLNAVANGAVTLYHNGVAKIATSATGIAVTGDTTITSGNLVIGTAGKGIDFSATADGTTMSSELLDDYEEGTWTPELGRWTGDAISATYTLQAGWYVRVGNLVTVGFYINTSAIASQGSSIVYILNKPFTNNGDYNYGFSGAIAEWGAFSNPTGAKSFIPHSTNNAILVKDTTAGNHDDDWQVGAVSGSITYFVD
jgi:hypothetical protein